MSQHRSVFRLNKEPCLQSHLSPGIGTQGEKELLYNVLEAWRHVHGLVHVGTKSFAQEPWGGGGVQNESRLNTGKVVFVLPF
jgi:hypothetical protein